MITVVVANNHWANIGDAFYQISIISDLQKAYGDNAQVFSGEEHPFYIHSRWNGRKSAYLDYSLYTECDWYVVSGPIMGYDTPKRFSKLFANLKTRGTKIVFISTGSNHYDKKEVQICRDFLKEYHPYVFSTRDSHTYDAYGDLADYAYNGICSAYYSSVHYSGYDTESFGKYITIADFKGMTEPVIIFRGDPKVGLQSLDDITIQSDTVQRMSRLEVLWDNFRNYPTTIGGLRVIRPIHEPVAKLSLMTFNRPNKFVSINPYGYLNIFRNTEITISNRVHACVPTLSYQKPAFLCHKTKRAALFERLGLGEITERPVTLSKDVLLKEHHAFISFLRRVPL